MNSFLHKIQGLVAAGNTQQAIKDAMEVLLQYASATEVDPLTRELWEEVNALDQRWRIVVPGAETGAASQMEIARINFLLVELARRWSVIHPALAARADRSFHYAHHLRDHVSGFLGKTIGGYKLTEFVGLGGFGTVFKARHGYLQRTAAVKVSHPIAEGERVIDELLSVSLPPLQHLDHAYVARILDAGEIKLDSYRRMYVVTEYIEGGTLREFCQASDKSSPQRIRASIDIALKICEGLARCHATKYFHPAGFEVTGIKHGDLKPENILLDAQQNPKLIDFMFVDLTKLYRVLTLQPEFVNSQGYGTRMFGTYGYMAPEQRDQGIVTEQSDIYALGVVLLEMFGRVLLEKSAPLSFASPEEVASHLPEGVPFAVSRVIHRATRSNPAERYRSVREVQDELQQAIPATPTAPSSAAKVFISYRRKDSAVMAGRICDHLRHRLGNDAVFMDVYTIPAGVDFRDYLTSAVADCDVLLALIGPGWDAEATRLSDPGDFIRIELETALANQCLVIPVLLANAQMPVAEKLPEPIKVLVFRNALAIDHGKDYHAHMEVLLRSIEAVGMRKSSSPN
jgi:serine/threonine protein kinase